MYSHIILYSDGGARGNPGPAGVGVVMYAKDTLEEIQTIAEYIGEATNNQAEYTALLKGLEGAIKLGAQYVECYLDSELVVKQLNREYKVKNKNIAPLFVKVWNLTQQFKSVTFRHVRREKNKVADSLVNKAIDAHLAS